jgi:hypothetical protein
MRLRSFCVIDLFARLQQHRKKYQFRMSWPTRNFWVSDDEDAGGGVVKCYTTAQKKKKNHTDLVDSGCERAFHLPQLSRLAFTILVVALRSRA